MTILLASIIIFALVNTLINSIAGGDFDAHYALLGYPAWIKGIILHANLGKSYSGHAPVASIIARNAWPTILLMGSSLVLSVLIAVPFGAYSATRRNSALDNTGRVLFFAGFSLPGFWLGAIFQLVLGVYLTGAAGYQVLYISGIHVPGNGSFLDLLRHLALPVLTLSLASVAQFVRFQRGAMLEALSQDYVRTARAKGLKGRAVNFKHALRNALVPTVTLFALSMGTISGGAVIIETVFSWPGLGYLFIDSLRSGDFEVMRALMLINALFIVFFNLVADLAYALLDPRVNYE